MQQKGQKKEKQLRTGKFYITTTLPYVNAIPHIGHTSEFIKADVIARYKRKVIGTENVWFNTGTDEHGLKNLQKAEEHGRDVKEYIDEIVVRWKEFCNLFDISYDTFFRTTDQRHYYVAKKFWEQCDANGDIYKKEYAGWYCVGCEEYKTEKDLNENKECKIHKKKTEYKQEENYFFRLSKYKEDLLKWLDENPDVLKPKKARTELVNWIKEMKDISISRNKSSLKWGIDVPVDDSQVMYVWFDALTNYIDVLGYGQDDEYSIYEGSKNGRYSEWWPGVQIFGVDNLRFQGAIWQGMLASVKQPQTRQLLRNGFILAADGTKMSKSLGNVISPFDQADKFGVEAVRFYMITGIATFTDSPYKEDDLVDLYNSHLVNKFGNLLNRVVHLANKYEVELNNHHNVELEFMQKVDSFYSKIIGNYEGYELQTASLTTDRLSEWGNEYITLEEPWSKDKTTAQRQKVLNNLSYLLYILIEAYEPIIPKACARARHILAKREQKILFPKLEVE